MRFVALLTVGVMLAGCTARMDLERGTGIEGGYVVNGVDPNGVEYSGRLVISGTDQPTVYTLDWIITGAILHGEGILNGVLLDVTWESVNAPGGSSSGTASYEISDTGGMRGTRSVDGYDGVGTEEVFPEP